jgi:hypothetical protein
MWISERLFSAHPTKEASKEKVLSRTAIGLLVAQAVGRVGEGGFEGLDADGEQG